MTHPVAWTAPQPFWQSAPGQARVPLDQPQILRFANDEFIEELLATLQRNPTALPAYQAQGETWRQPMVGPQVDRLALVKPRPSRLLPLVRRTAAAHGTAARPPASGLPLKLFQPAQMRHYLVAGALVCRTPGLPDRAVDAGRQKASHVLRRLVLRDGDAPNAARPEPTELSKWDEYAWVLVGKSGEWRYAGPADRPGRDAKLIDGEERLPTFPARFTDPAGQPRRLFIGSVPVGRRETYQSAQIAPPDPAQQAPAADPRLVQLRTDVLGPWRAFVNKARDLQGHPPSVIYRGADEDKPFDPFDFNTGVLDKIQLYRLRSELQLAAWYVLLDLRAWLGQHFRGYVDWLDGHASGAPTAGTTERAVHDLLATVATPAELLHGSQPLHAGGGFTEASVAVDLPDALRRVKDFEAALEIALTGDPAGAADAFSIPAPALGVPGVTAGWPNFLFLFVDPLIDVPTPVPGTAAPGPDDFGSETLQAQIDALADALEPLLAPLDPAASLPQPTLASMQPSDMRDAWYVMRMVFERPDCEPFEDAVLSRATVPFRLAGFFDSDAPARPIRIGLPVDISPAGLRKFDKNAVFMLSDMLCGQIDRFRGITFGDLVLSVLPWPFHKDLSLADKGPCKSGGDPLGTMCSLSIPIITICALILLTVIVALLDLIFHWLPLFVVCFPLPGFKGRKGGA